MAGLVAYRLGQERLPIPAWVRAARPLPTPWFVDPYHADESSVDDTPPALRRLGVIIDEHDLRSV